MAHRLTTAARRNTKRRRDACEELIRRDGIGQLTRFASLVRRSTFSSNVAADKILAFGECDEVLDGRRLRVHQAGGNRRRGMAQFRSSSWYPRREAFEAMWQYGRRLVYGAVNAGNMGTEGQYGAFCLVVSDPARSQPDALAVFPSDTAQRYTDLSASPDDELCRCEATLWEDRDALAVEWLAPEVLKVQEDDWPELVCRPDHYLEVVVAPLPLAAVDEVRLRRDDLERFERLELEALAGERLSNVESNELGAFLAISRWRAASAVKVVVM